MNWDWKKLLQQVIPVVLSWLLGALGVGPAPLTPDRVLNQVVLKK